MALPPHRCLGVTVALQLTIPTFAIFMERGLQNREQRRTKSFKAFLECSLASRPTASGWAPFGADLMSNFSFGHSAARDKWFCLECCTIHIVVMTPSSLGGCVTRFCSWSCRGRSLSRPGSESLSFRTNQLDLLFVYRFSGCLVLLAGQVGPFRRWANQTAWRALCCGVWLVGVCAKDSSSLC